MNISSKAQPKYLPQPSTNNKDGIDSEPECNRGSDSKPLSKLAKQSSTPIEAGVLNAQLENNKGFDGKHFSTFVKRRSSPLSRI
jgi:hypothetical protein